MTAILHLSHEKGTEKRDLKIAPVLSVLVGTAGSLRTLSAGEGGEPASFREVQELPGWEHPGLGLKDKVGFLL